jgi:hypothetical protein
VAGYVDTSTVTDAKDAGAAKAFAGVWVPSSSKDVTLTAAKEVAASLDSALRSKLRKVLVLPKKLLGPASSELPLTHHFYPGVSPVSVKQ